MMFADYRDTSRAIFDSGWPTKPRRRSFKEIESNCSK
jgi:hypothetical protein